MPLMRCATTSNGLPWSILHSVIAAYFGGILLYCVVPVVRRWAIFKRLSPHNRLLRLTFTICVAIKFLFHSTAVILSHVADPSVFLMGGICLLEFPCYLTSTCFSVVLMFWLYVCAEIVPGKYAARFKFMRTVLIVFNVLVYLVFVAGATLTGEPKFAGDGFGPTFMGWAAIGRDFALGLLFVAFVINLRIGLRQYVETSETVDERRLMKFTLVLSVCVLLRGSVTLIQSLFFQDRPSECEAGFLVAFSCAELLFEGGPFLFLIRVNNDFLIVDEKTDGSAGFVSTVFDGLTG
jgi:hypothetical protein